MKIDEDQVIIEKAKTKKQKEEYVRKKSMTLLFALELQTYDDVILRLQKAKTLSIEDEILD